MITTKQYKEDMLQMLHIMKGLNLAIGRTDPDNVYVPNISKVIDKKITEILAIPNDDSWDQYTEDLAQKLNDQMLNRFGHNEI